MSEVIHPGIVAHRGYAGRYPENTLPAVEAALRAGVRHVEIDIQLTADGTPVLFHDHTLARTTGARGRITDITSDRLAGLDAGERRRFGRRFQGVRVPRLDEFVLLLEAWPGATAFIEIKQESIDVHGLEPTVRCVIAGLAPLRSRCVVISFNAAAIAAAGAYGARTGWVVSAWNAAQHAQAAALAPEFLFCNHRKLPPDGQPAWAGPWQWVFYEVTRPAHALALAGRGAAFIETMRLEAFTRPPWSLEVE